ncbi:hypothetical protein [Corynebacterium kutscheri]|uniref:hypothetical protein n=1 Tax=Corynebacterium kutscheri TaxID=35755 RepID=UPI000A577837|nr:Uncharacterised protein [Corynebacterium kutscheri]
MDQTETTTSQHETPTPNDVAAKTTEAKNQDTQPEMFDREYVEKLRREAAGYRTKLKEIEPLAAQFKKQQEESKTELDKALERIAELEASEQRKTIEAARSGMAAKHGVPVELLPVTADSEELEAAAQALVAWAEKKTSKGAPKVDSAGGGSVADDRDAIARKRNIPARAGTTGQYRQA